MPEGNGAMTMRMSVAELIAKRSAASEPAAAVAVAESGVAPGGIEGTISLVVAAVGVAAVKVDCVLGDDDDGAAAVAAVTEETVAGQVAVESKMGNRKDSWDSGARTATGDEVVAKLGNPLS